MTQPNAVPLDPVSLIAAYVVIVGMASIRAHE